jgi:hypothetical protein
MGASWVNDDGTVQSAMSVPSDPAISQIFLPLIIH